MTDLLIGDVGYEITEAVTVSDAIVNVETAFLIDVPETVTVDESGYVLFPLAINLSEDITVSETQYAFFPLVLFSTEAVTVSEIATNVETAFLIGISESIAIGEIRYVFLSLSLSVTDHCEVTLGSEHNDLYLGPNPALKSLVDADFHRPYGELHVDGGTAIPILSATIEHGMELVTASASVTLSPNNFLIEPWYKTIQIVMGYLEPSGVKVGEIVFEGYITDTNISYEDSNKQDLSAVGWLGLAQQNWPGIEIVDEDPEGKYYNGYTDKAIVLDLLSNTGICMIPISHLDINGGVALLGTSLYDGIKDGLKLNPGDSPYSMIEKLDQAYGYKTYDSRDGVIHRRKYIPAPTGVAYWNYTQGVNILSIDRPRTVSGICNQIEIIGNKELQEIPRARYGGANTYLPVGMPSLLEIVENDFIETFSTAHECAARLIKEKNRVSENISVRVPGNPIIYPNLTISIEAAKVGINTATTYYLNGISHTFGPDGFFTTLLCQGGLGLGGQKINLPPKASMGQPTYATTSEATEPLLVRSAKFVSTSEDPDQPISSLSYAWTSTLANPSGGVIVSGADTPAYFMEGLVEADWGQVFSVTLTITDTDGATSSAKKVVDSTSWGASSSDGQIPSHVNRKVYLATGRAAQASNDSGAAWHSWVKETDESIIPCISTPNYPGAITGWFGFEDGTLYKTTNSLITAPALLLACTDAIICIAVNRADEAFVSVGTRDGKIYVTTDGSTFTETATNVGNPINDIWVDPSNPAHQYAATGATVLETPDYWGNYNILLTFTDGTVKTFVMNSFGTYAMSDGGERCMTITGVAMNIPLTTPDIADCRAAAGNKFTDKVLIVDSGQRVLLKDVRISATDFNIIRSVANVGIPRILVADPVDKNGYWLLTSLYLLYSGDGGLSWSIIRKCKAYDGGYQFGISESGYSPIAAASFMSGLDVGGRCYRLPPEEPDQGEWQKIGATIPGEWGDYLEVTAGVIAEIEVNFTPIAEATWVCYEIEAVGGDALTYFQAPFTLAAGAITTATLLLQVDDYAEDVWINGILLYGETSRVGEPPYMYHNIVIPPYMLVTGENSIAIAVRNTSGDVSYIAMMYKLEVS